MTELIAALRSGRVLLMDGAMGTELQRRTQGAFEGYEPWNRSRAELILSVHRDYVGAGAEVVLTNTFQANPLALPNRDEHHAIWEAGLRIARAADPRFVLADIGPLKQLTAAAARQLADESRHADGVLLETWSSLDDLQRFAAALGEAGDGMPALLVSFTFQRGNSEGTLMTFMGARPEACARAALDSGAAAIGVNCGLDIRMSDMIELVERYRSVCDLPIFVRPNAGTPTSTASGWIYPHTAAELTEALPSLLEAGVGMVGGCCGTTPETIRAFRKVVDDWNAAGARSPKASC